MNVKKIGLCFLCATVLWISACTPRTDPPQQLDYRDSVEGAAGMYIESLTSPNAKLYNLGETSLAGVPQYAIKFGTNPEIEDSGTRNAILIECGMHAREWFAAESCYWLVDYLIAYRDKPEIRSLWESVDIWVLPQSNPAGREIDDLSHGDPTQFLHVCKGGSDEGDACTQNSDCNSGDCYGTGWRTNANTSQCAVGVDLARNFSSGWNSAADNCTVSDFMKYRGPYPFSEPETLNLRHFIHNHMVSTVLIVHANSQETWNRWATASTANDNMVDELVNLNSTGVGSESEADMPRSSVGSGSGQFSAWLTQPSSAWLPQPSNVAGELDLDTERNISTFFFELPISGSPNPYYSDDYKGDYYSFTAGDGSNSFHPSSSVWYRMFTDSILPMMIDVIRQAGSPQCPLDDGFGRMTSSCEANDFGLVGMKIAKGIDEPGALGFDPNTREETLAEGVYSVVFAVQNFSSDSSRKTTNATVEIYKDVLGTRTLDNSPAPRISITLDPGTRGVFTVEHGFAVDETYRVEVTLDTDDFTRDNTKSMAFRVARRMMRARPFDERLVENLEVWPMKADASKWVFEGQLSLTAKASQQIVTADVEVVVFPRRAAAVPRPLVWKAPVKLTSTAQQQTVSPEAIARLSQKTSPRLAELDLTPGKKRDRHALRLVVDDPLLAKALAEGGTVLMRLTVDDPNIVAFGLRLSEVEPYLKVDPKNAEEDVEDEP